VHLALSYNSNKGGVELLGKKLVEEYSQKFEGKPPLISYHRADMSNVEETSNLAKEAMKEHGRGVDILIANAGFGKRITDIE
jgi:3-oxoacyl-[acyl-carrier protein] reductase